MKDAYESMFGRETVAEAEHFMPAILPLTLNKPLIKRVMEQAKNAGAVIIKSAQDTFWGGYAGYFQDPNGHLWEIAWNPQWPIPE